MKFKSKTKNILQLRLARRHLADLVHYVQYLETAQFARAQRAPRATLPLAGVALSVLLAPNVHVTVPVSAINVLTRAVESAAMVLFAEFSTMLQSAHAHRQPLEIHLSTAELEVFVLVIQ